jgi:adenine-specific DNA-methyltransferase
MPSFLASANNTGEEQLLSAVEIQRVKLSHSTPSKKKSQFGQFFTPASTAAFMASLFPDGNGICRLLDAGAGIGSLSAAFLTRWQSAGFQFEKVMLDAFELDHELIRHLSDTLTSYNNRGNLEFNIREADFIHAAVDSLSGSLFSTPPQSYTHAILNPPYKKINSNSAHRHALRRVGIETVNLYSAFVSLAAALMAPGGQMVAIIPRSFCNGPYYKPFREFILEHCAIRRMHLFGSRNKAFKDDEVLQEHVIIHLECGAEQAAVMVSTSTDDTFDDLVLHEHPYERIVFPGDSEGFIHIPTSQKISCIELSSAVRHTLDDIGLKVSTGPVVDFRLKSHLRDMPDSGTVPLLYPSHFSGYTTTWPLIDSKKPNAVERNGETEKWLYPNGFYCIVRRFSSKEEKRRIVASVVDPDTFADSPVLGFENHLNVFHENKKGIPKMLAWGLAVYLNSSAVDERFRRFNGHTQVNATDLRTMKYPDRETLIELGEWAMQQKDISQSVIDEKIGSLT